MPAWTRNQSGCGGVTGPFAFLQPGEHRAALTRIAGGEDYRTESLTTTELVAVIGARDVSRPVRLAAAFALSTAEDPGALRRARQTVQSIADEAERDDTLAALGGSLRS